MRKILIKISFVLLSFIFISCGDEGYKISSSDELAKIKNLAIEQFGDDLEIYSLTISSDEDLSIDLGSLNVRYFKDDGARYSNEYNTIVYGDELNLRGEEKYESISKFKNKFDDPKSYGKIRIKDLDFDKIIKDVQKALDGEDVGNWNIKTYSFNVAPKTNKISSNFTVQYTASENATSLQGKNVVTNYNELRISIDASGTIKRN